MPTATESIASPSRNRLYKHDAMHSSAILPHLRLQDSDTYKGQSPALNSEMMLFDTSTGRMTALINADWITSARTGAVAALAINTLSNSNARIYSFIGLGVIGHSVPDCLLATNCDRRITIRLKRYKDHAESTMSRYASFDNIDWEIADSMEELVSGADVVVSCITDAEGLLVEDTNLFEPGVLTFRSILVAFKTATQFSTRSFADDRAHVESFKYFNQFRHFAEIGDVLSGRVIGRETDEERILSYNIGLGCTMCSFANKLINRPPLINHLIFMALQSAA